MKTNFALAVSPRTARVFSGYDVKFLLASGKNFMSERAKFSEILKAVFCKSSVFAALRTINPALVSCAKFDAVFFKWSKFSCGFLNLPLNFTAIQATPQNLKDGSQRNSAAKIWGKFGLDFSRLSSKTLGKFALNFMSALSKNPIQSNFLPSNLNAKFSDFTDAFAKFNKFLKNKAIFLRQTFKNKPLGASAIAKKTPSTEKKSNSPKDEYSAKALRISEILAKQNLRDKFLSPETSAKILSDENLIRKTSIVRILRDKFLLAENLTIKISRDKFLITRFLSRAQVAPSENRLKNPKERVNQ